MRKFNIKSLLLLFAMMAFVMASCLEDTGYLDIYNGENAGPVVSFGQADHGFVVRTVEVNTAPQDITLGVNVARAAGDVTVTVALDPTALEDYNRAHRDEPGFTPYKMLPDSAFTLNVTSVTIPAGAMDATLPISVVSSKISLEHAYMVPVKITTSTEGTVIASNLSTALIAIGVKNIYDGVYQITGGSITRNSATGPDLTLGGNYRLAPPIEIEVSTVTATRSAFQPTWRDGSGIAGIDGTNVTVNPATNLATMASSNATLKNIAGLENSYDPATKTFTLNFDWGAAPSNRIINGLKLKWVRARN